MPFLENTVANASVLTIFAISIERYRVICRPLTGIRERKKSIVKVVIIIWFVSALGSVPSLYFAIYRDSRYLDGTPIKVCRNTVEKDWHKVYIVSLALFFFGIPCSILFIIYSKICWVLNATQKEHINMDDAHKHRDRKLLKFQVINIITSIVFLFFICHLPLRVIGLWISFEKANRIARLGMEAYYNILYFGRIMFYLNHAINPIIYNFVSTRFRCAVRYMLTGRGQFGSFISSQKRQKKANTRPNRQRPCHLLLVEPGPKCEDRENKRDPSSSTSSDARQKRNEFFPMYAHIIQGSAEDSNTRAHKCAHKCELQIHLLDKQVSLDVNYVSKNRFNP